MHSLKMLFVKIYEIIRNKKIEKSVVASLPLIKNQFYGKRCFVVGGGPSINKMDLSVLCDEYTVAVNKGYKLKEKGLNNVNFFGCSDHSAMKEYMKGLPDDFYEYFFLFRDVEPVKKFNGLSTFSAYTENGQSMADGYFQLNPDKEPCTHSFTIVLYVLQVLVWLGFKDIYFVGVDNDFQKKQNNHWYKDSKKELNNINVWDVDPTYHNSKSFEEAHKFLKEHGVNIYNAGLGGKLDTIPRVDFYQLFK